MARDAAGGTNTVDVWTMGDLDTARSQTHSTDDLSIWVKIGLTGLFLALATPLVGAGGLWMTALLGQLAAEGLELSHATLPAFPLEGDWDLRLAYLLALTAMGLRALVSRMPRQRWTVAGLGPWPLWLMLGGGLWLTSLSALTIEQHVLDIADGTHLVLLGMTALWTSSTTVWLLASIGHAGLIRVAVIARGSRTMGMATAATGIASMAIVTPALASADALEPEDVYHDAPLLGGAFAQLDEARHDLRDSMAPGASGTTPAALPPAGGSTNDARYTTAECMEELATRRPGKRSSPVEEVVRNVQSRLEGRDLAREIVHTKMIDICEDEPARNGTPLLHLLQRATRYGVYDVFRGDHGIRLASGSSLGQGSFQSRCLIDGRSDELLSFEELQHRHFTIETALRSLSKPDRRLIQERYFEGRNYDEMARHWDRSKDTITRRTNRAVERLGVALDRHCH